MLVTMQHRIIASAEHVADRVEFVRLYLGLSQNDFAAALGATAAQYSNWKQARQRMPLAAALRLADAYGVTLDFTYLARLSGLPGDMAADWIDRTSASSESPDDAA